MGSRRLVQKKKKNNYDTSESDSPKLGNALFSSFTTALNILCKPLPILFSGSFDPLRSFYICLIRHVFLI